ncbi:MAG: DUF1573 domain-containing protein [Bacteroidota bacterium]|jgi:hypothetical protein
MRYLFMALLVLFALPAVHAQKKNKKKTEETNASLPPVTVQLRFSETNYDFGKIPQGRPVYHVFSIENTGLDTLKVENVQTSCGCTTPEYSKDPVLKGGKLDLKVGYNAASEGNFEKSITVTYNGGQTKQLFIKGLVWKTPDQSVPSNPALKTFY